MEKRGPTRAITVPDTYHKVTGVKDTHRQLEDQAWSDLCELIDNKEYPFEIYGYFLVYFLWNISSSTQYGKSIIGDNIVDQGQIYGEQAAGSLIVTTKEIILQAHHPISKHFPAYPPVLSKGGLVNMFLSGLVDKKVIALNIYPKDITLRIPLEGLRLAIQSHVSLRDAVAIEHPEVGYLRIEQHFTDDNGKIAQMIRAAQNELHRQEHEETMQQMVAQLTAEGMEQELKTIAPLRELNLDAYESARQAIMKKYTNSI